MLFHQLFFLGKHLHNVTNLTPITQNQAIMMPQNSTLETLMTDSWLFH